MRATIKSLQSLNALSDIKTYTVGARKSAKPALPTTHILDLYMRRNERDRLLKEIEKSKKEKNN